MCGARAPPSSNSGYPTPPPGACRPGRCAAGAAGASAPAPIRCRDPRPRAAGRWPLTSSRRGPRAPPRAVDLAPPAALLRPPRAAAGSCSLRQVPITQNR
ncbi:hypothetical protein ZWY2020_033063 [Hordeum vulgare]|nr:hypothetical protein ZWY2020_033063 [Hordeum vulgare]